MNEGIFKTVAVGVILGLASYCYLLRCEVREYDQALKTYDNGFRELMVKKVNGRPLISFLNPDQIGVFGIGGQSIGCVILNTPLPDSKK